MQNQKQLDDKLTKARDKKCEPVATQILEAIGSANLSTSAKEWEVAVKEYYPLGSKINQIMKDADLTISEVNYTWSIVQSVIDTVKRLSNEAVQVAFELLESRWLGVDKVSDLSLQKLDNMLQLGETQLK
jgi:hypothetical protein